MVAKVSSVDTPMTQCMSAGKRRATPIIPAIPRKLERKTQPDAERTSSSNAEGNDPKQSAKDPSESNIHVTNHSNLSPADLENGEEESSRPVSRASVSEQVLAEGNALPPPQTFNNPSLPYLRPERKTNSPSSGFWDSEAWVPTSSSLLSISFSTNIFAFCAFCLGRAL